MRAARRGGRPAANACRTGKSQQGCPTHPKEDGEAVRLVTVRRQMQLAEPGKAFLG